MEAKRQWIVVTALIGVAVLVAGFMFFVKPQYHQADSLKKQEDTVIQQTKTLRTKLAVLKDQQTKLPAKQAELAALAVKVPAGANLADLTAQLQAAAHNIPQPPDSGRATPTLGSVDMSVLSPGSPTSITATAGASATSSTTTTAGTAVSLQQIPLRFTVSGTFFNLEAFLDRLENMHRAIVVDTFSISYQGSIEDPKTPGTGELMVSISARAFMTTTPLTGTAAR